MSASLKIVSNVKVADGISMATSYTGESFRLDHIDGFSIQFIWSAGVGMAGTLTLEASLDGSNFSTVQGSSQAVSGATGNHIWDVIDFQYPYVRVKFTASAGSATGLYYLCKRARQQ